MADCSEYKELIQLVIDDEATKKEEAYLRRHLKMCLQCLDQYKIDQELKEVLRLKLQKLEVPEGLAETIRGKLVG
ncbi:MAG: zf-HC2 domain-containing protein [Cyclobacteriaceae bacterium]